MLRGTLAIALVALTASACLVSRSVTAVKSEELKVKSEVRDSSRVEQVMVAVHDTLTITKTITIRENEQGDTVRMSVMTDRDRSRSMYDVRSKKEEVRVVRDTVYVAVRDSVLVDRGQVKGDSYQSGGTALHRALKWVFWIVVAITVLVVVIRVKS